MTDELKMESMLQEAFSGDETPQPAVKAEVPDPVAEDVAEAAEAAEALPDEPSDDTPAEADPSPVSDPEYEIEVDGERVTVKGADQVKELLQKGMHYSKRSEVTARVQESLVARAQMMQQQEQFNVHIMGDLTELKALDAQLDQYNKIDWSQAFDSDPFNALKLREQRDQLREARTAKLNGLNQKHEQFKQGQANAAQQILASENQALLSKVPEWRNHEKATVDKQEIARMLVHTYGYQPAELALMDHRVLVAAKDLLEYQRIKSGKSAALKQVRDAPPVVKPGTVQKQTNGRTEFQKARASLKELGRRGNHKGQEAVFTELLTKTYK